MADTMVKVDIEEIMNDIREDIRQQQGDEVNVGQILDEVTAQVKAANPAPVPEFSHVRELAALNRGADLSTIPPMMAITENSGVYAQIENEARYLKGSSYISCYWELGKGPKAFIKRFIRKMSKFLLLPLCERQTDYNMHTANGVDALRTGVELQQTLLAQLNERIEGQWSAIELLQEHTGLSGTDENEERGDNSIQTAIESLEMKMEEMSREIQEQADMVNRQRKEMFVNNDRLRTLQESQKKLAERCEAQKKTIEQQAKTIRELQEQISKSDRRPVDSRRASAPVEINRKGKAPREPINP